MKKKLAAILTMLMVLSIGTTVFAAGSSDSSEAAVQAQKQNVESVQFHNDGADEALAYEAVTASDLSEANTKAKSVSEDAEILGMVDVAAPNGVDTSKGITLTISAPGVKAGDNIRVLHKKADGTWETIKPSKVSNGSVTATFTSLSPIAIVRYPVNANPDADNSNTSDGTDNSINNSYNNSDRNNSANSSNSVNPNNSTNVNNSQSVTINQTVSGGKGASSATSPKTGSALPVLPVIAVFAFMGVAVCGKKLRSLS